MRRTDTVRINIAIIVNSFLSRRLFEYNEYRLLIDVRRRAHYTREAYARKPRKRNCDSR